MRWPTAREYLLAAMLGGLFGLWFTHATSVQQRRPISPPFIFTDAFTGKQYVVNPAGGIWPRMNDQGRHMTEWEQPR